MKFFNKKTGLFSRLHPSSLLLYFLLLLIYTFFCDYDKFLIYIFISYFLSYVFYDEIKVCLKSLNYYVHLTLLTGIFNVIFNHQGTNVFLYINDVPLTFDSLFYGLFTGVFVSCIMLWFSILNLFFKTDKILYIFGKHFPSIAVILCTAFSYLDCFRYKLLNIEHILFTQGQKHKNIKYGATAFSLLMTVMLEDSQTTADSMLSRGYTSTKKKNYQKYKFTITDFIICSVSICLFVLSFYNKYIILIMILLPVVTDILTEVRWKCYQLKI